MKELKEIHLVLKANTLMGSEGGGKTHREVKNTSFFLNCALFRAKLVKRHSVITEDYKEFSGIENQRAVVRNCSSM